MQSDPYLLGATAGKNGRKAVVCPFPTGSDRKEWLAGFFSAKPSLPEEKQRSNRKASATRQNFEQSLDFELVQSSRIGSSFRPTSDSATNAEEFESEV